MPLGFKCGQCSHKEKPHLHAITKRYDPSGGTSGKCPWQRWIGKKSAESAQLIAAFVSFLGNVTDVTSMLLGPVPESE